MDDFLAILNLIKTLIVMLFNVRIPLGSDYSIRWGSIVLGILGLYLAMRLIFRLFSDSGPINDNKKE